MPSPRIGVIISYGEERLFLERYGPVLAGAGALPVYLPYPARDATLEAYLELADGLVATGGEDIDPARYGEGPLPGGGGHDRARDEFELALLRRAIDRDRPLLAICRGIQALNVAVGGSLYQDVGTQVPGALRHQPALLWEGPGHLAACEHEVSVDGGSLLAGVVGRARLAVNSYHHQAVREPGAGVRVAARAPDGVVEAIELPGCRFAIGLQWHPELLLGRDAGSEAILGCFVDACRRRAVSGAGLAGREAAPA